MSSLNHNIPDFAPPLNYQHKIDPNAAWVSSKPSSFAPVARGRSPPPPRILAPTTIWGTPVPNWKIDDQVLVQLYSPGGEWHQATVLAVFPPVEFETLSKAQLEALPPARLAKMTAQYTVKIVEGDNSAHIWNAVPERFIAPMDLAEKLRANVLKFARGERVLVLMSAGDKRHEHVGHVSNVFGDKIIRVKNKWDVIPRLYQVFINDLGISGHWTAESIVKLEPQSPSTFLQSPTLIVPSQPSDAWEVE